MKRINRCYCFLIIVFFLCNFTFWQWIGSLDPCLWQNLSSCCCPSNWALSDACQDRWYDANSCTQWWNTQWWNNSWWNSQWWNNSWWNNSWWNNQWWTSDVWINITTDCLLNWQCSLNVYKVLGIRQSNENPTVLWFLQDITLASTTAILWTILVIALIVSWLVFSFASITWKDTKKSKSILIDCLVWVLLVRWSYAIIRLIQFLATAWS